jgi:hypothetical protein
MKIASTLQNILILSSVGLVSFILFGLVDTICGAGAVAFGAYLEHYSSNK